MGDRRRRGPVDWDQSTFERWGPDPRTPEAMRIHLDRCVRLLCAPGVDVADPAIAHAHDLATRAEIAIVAVEATEAPTAALAAHPYGAWCRPDCARNRRGYGAACSCDRYLARRRAAIAAESQLRILSWHVDAIARVMGASDVDGAARRQ